MRLQLVTAPNPSPLTGTGTNTWIIASDGEVAVIDPGPAIPSHLQAIAGAVGQGGRLAAILVTHAHLDHSQAAPDLAAASGAPVLAFGPAGAGQRPQMAALAAAGLTSAEGLDLAFRPDRCLADGERLRLGALEIEALHTPGHSASHLAFACGDLLFSGDHVMGWATSLVSPPDGDMGAYMASLRRLQGRDWRRMLPGHGPAIETPAARLAELIAHRRGREEAVLQALAEGPADAATLARAIYDETPAALLPAAARNVLAHLIDLEERKLVAASASIRADTVFRRR